MLHGIKVYFATLPIFLAIDFFWLGFLMAKFYKMELGPLSRGASDTYETVWWADAVALIWGGLYGFVLYAVYDMTNYALVARWPLKMSIVDICWGIFICSTVSTVAAYFDRWIR
jgi:uncharacterized membrane protein